MVKSRAFLVVGHSDWGKSKTIRALTANQHGWVKLKGKWFFVRLMSNDDIKNSYQDFINRLNPTYKPAVVMAYCPENPSSPLITMLSKKYDLFLWVLKYKFDSEEIITTAEIAALKKFGKVECYTRQNAEDVIRAKALAKFIAANLK